MKKLVALIVTIMVLVALVLPVGASANGVCPTLPSSPVTAVWTTNNWTTSYFTITLSGAGDLNGTYDGYCVDLDSGAPQLGQAYSAQLICTYDAAAAGYVDKPENLDLVNWILNDDHIGTDAGGALGIYTWFDDQMAFWQLLEDPPSGGWAGWYPGFPSDQGRVDALIALAQANGEGFEPAVDELCAVLVIPLDGDARYRQISMITVTVPPEDGDEGCTPGYWKANADNWEAVSWVDYAPGDDFSDTFGIAEQTLRANGKKVYTNPTLREALDANGSGINLLARSAVAALLNAANTNINYPRTEADIIADVQAAIAAGPEAIQALGEELDYDNNLGCPINQKGESIVV